MTYTFQSRATSDVIMLGDAARELLRLIGKDDGSAKGIVTVEQLPDAIERLREAVERDRARQAALREQEDDEIDEDDEPAPTGMAAPVGLAQRGWPLLEMMRASLEEGVPVVWGV